MDFAWTANIFYEFQSALALVDVVLMQTQKFSMNTHKVT